MSRPRPMLPLFLLVVWPVLAAAQAVPLAPASPSKWEPDFAKFAALDRETPPPAGAVLFTGSSSIRKWDLASTWPGLPYLNRGFGGSRLSDCVFHFDRLVTPYRPKAVVLYAGDNDFAQGASVTEVVRSFSSFAARLQETLPGTLLLFIAIKPSRKRWALWPAMAEANRAIAALCAASPTLDFADIAAPMLATATKPEAAPKAALFESDGLHMSLEGYALWKQVIQPWLDQHAH